MMASRVRGESHRLGFKSRPEHHVISCRGNWRKNSNVSLSENSRKRNIVRCTGRSTKKGISFIATAGESVLGGGA